MTYPNAVASTHEGNHRIRAESPAAVAGRAVRPDNTTPTASIYFPTPILASILGEESWLQAQLTPPDPSHAR
jgi:hypothetical protein